MEVTKWLKPSISVSRIGGSASVQAATRVNVEQASKRTMCRPTRLPYRGRLKWLGELSEDYAPLLHRGIGGGMYTRKPAFVVERSHLGPFDRGGFPGERGNDAMIAANDERQVVDDIVDRNRRRAGSFLDWIEH